MIEPTVESIMEEARRLEGRARKRCLSRGDAKVFVELREDNPGKRVRVYSCQGFVPNSYHYRADITFVECGPNGSIVVGRTAASRSNGRGSLRVVGNRGYHS
jgi:hypothetical protein